jgi:hypothetical protein
VTALLSAALMAVLLGLLWWLGSQAAKLRPPGPRRQIPHGPLTEQEIIGFGQALDATEDVVSGLLSEDLD